MASIYPEANLNVLTYAESICFAMSLKTLISYHLPRTPYFSTSRELSINVVFGLHPLSHTGKSHLLLILDGCSMGKSGLHCGRLSPNYQRLPMPLLNVDVGNLAPNVNARNLKLSAAYCENALVINQDWYCRTIVRVLSRKPMCNERHSPGKNVEDSMAKLYLEVWLTSADCSSYCCGSPEKSHTNPVIAEGWYILQTEADSGMKTTECR